MPHEPDSHANDARDYERWAGFAPDPPPEKEYDHDDDPDFGKRGEQVLNVLRMSVDIALQRREERAELLDRLLTCVPGPHSKGYKLAEILKIAEEWNQIR